MALATQLVLWSGCLPALRFSDRVQTAAGAGFDAITVTPPTWRKAQRREGLTLAGMRAILDHHGITVAAVDGLSDWLPEVGEPLAVTVRPGTPRREVFEVAHALGADMVVAVHLRVPQGELKLAPASEAFGRLRDEASLTELRVGLEFVPFKAIRDVGTAWEIVRRAQRDNGGLILDVVHHSRGGRDDARLEAVDPNRIFAIQLCDAPRAAGHTA